MEPAAHDIHVLLVMIAPLSGALLTLVGKVLPRHSLKMPAFIGWGAASIYTILRTAPGRSAPVSRLYALGGWTEPYGIVLELNWISWAAIALGFLIALVLWLHTSGNKSYGSSFYLSFYFALFSLHGVLLSRDLFNLFVWFELLSLCSFILVAYERSPKALMAALRYLFLSTISIIVFLIGIWILYHYSASVSFIHIQEFLQNLSPSSPLHSQASLALVLITAGIITRSALFPFHTWLPPAHAAAPYPVSAFLSGFVIKAPLLALWHFFEPISASPINALLICLGAISALLGGIAAFLQKDAKLILAYSSVGQIGYIWAAFGVGGAAGRTAVLIYLSLHALSKALLFFTVGHVTESAGSRDTSLLRGMQRRHPYHTLLFWIAALSLMGLPFSAGHYAKHLISQSLYGHPAEWLLLPASAATAIALFRLAQIFTGKQDPSISPLPHHPAKTSQQRFPTKAALLLLAILCVVPAFFPVKTYRIFHYIVQEGSLNELPANFAWTRKSAVLKSLVTSLIGFAGLFLFRLQKMKRLTSYLLDFRFGLDWSLRLFVIGLLIFILFATFL